MAGRKLRVQIRRRFSFLRLGVMTQQATCSLRSLSPRPILCWYFLGLRIFPTLPARNRSPIFLAFQFSSSARHQSTPSQDQPICPSPLERKSGRSCSALPYPSRPNLSLPVSFRQSGRRPTLRQLSSSPLVPQVELWECNRFLSLICRFFSLSKRPWWL